MVEEELAMKLHLQEEAEEAEGALNTTNDNNNNNNNNNNDNNNNNTKHNIDYSQLFGDEDQEDVVIPGIEFVNYYNESQLESVMKLVGKDLSEPYSGRIEIQNGIYSMIDIDIDIHMYN